MYTAFFIKTRGHFPNDEAASKLIWLALRNITAEWARAAPDWKIAMNQFAILYGGAVYPGDPLTLFNASNTKFLTPPSAKLIIVAGTKRMAVFPSGTGRSGTDATRTMSSSSGSTGGTSSPNQTPIAGRVSSRLFPAIYP
jgi:hypothetical protein